MVKRSLKIIGVISRPSEELLHIGTEGQKALVGIMLRKNRIEHINSERFRF